MSRHAFWTIIVGNTPTAFRAPLREDLQPTLVQLQRTQPDAVIRWFEKGQLWETPGHAQDAALARQQADRPRRGPSWRPGGDHKDPREKYKVPRDVKRKRWAAQAAEGRGPWVGGPKGARMADRQQDGTRKGQRPASASAPRSRPGGGKTDRLLEKRSAVVGGRRPREGNVPIPGRTPNARGTERAEAPPRPPKNRLSKGVTPGKTPPARRKKREDE